MYDKIYKVTSSGYIKQGSLYFIDDANTNEMCVSMSPVDFAVTRNTYKFRRDCENVSEGTFSDGSVTMRLMMLLGENLRQETL